MKEERRRFNKQDYLDRQAKVRKSMLASDIDLLIVYDPANMCWLTGYDGWSFYVHQCVVIGADGVLFWYGRGIDAKGAELTTDLDLDNIVSYPDEYVMTPDRHPMEFLSRILENKSLNNKRIGLEKDNYYFSARALNLSIVNSQKRFLATKLVLSTGKERLSRTPKSTT